MHSCRGPAGSGVCLLVVILLLPMWSLPRHISLLAPNLRDAGRVAFKSSEERREEEREGTSGIGEGEGGAVPNRVRKRAETWELGRKGGKEGKGERRKGKERERESAASAQMESEPRQPELRAGGAALRSRCYSVPAFAGGRRRGALWK